MTFGKLPSKFWQRANRLINALITMFILIFTFVYLKISLFYLSESAVILTNNNKIHNVNNNNYSNPYNNDTPYANLSDDIFITVKTTVKFHRTRLPDILDTWFQFAPKNIYFVTDGQDDELQLKTGGHVIVSNCPATHSRQALCCKLAAEFDAYLQSDKSWFCHFDDDNYVNVPKLLETLANYDPKKDWYIGKSSTSRPIEIMYKEHGYPEKVSFWFATGGAGFCLSRSLASQMAPYASNGKFVDVGERIRLPDDVTMGFIIEYLLKKKLIVLDSFHSHLESMKSIPAHQLSDQVSLSAGGYNHHKNIVNIDGYFEESDDPNRFKSLHCLLYPASGMCHKAKKR